MAAKTYRKPRRVLIVSSHPLFGKGLRSLLHERKEADVSVVGMVSSVDEAIAALDTMQPDLVVVDYDDERVNRDEFLARFVEGAARLRVVLLSLKEGGSEAIVYDRRTMAAAQIDDWLRDWTVAGRKPGVTQKKRRSIWGDRSQIPGVLKPRGKQTDPRREEMKHFLFAALVVIVLAGVMIWVSSQVRLLPVAASLQAGPIDWLFDLHFKSIAILFALIVGLMVYSIIVFRRKAGDDTDAVHIEGNTTLEVIWTIVPLAVVIYLAYIGARILGIIQVPDPNALQVRVVASQWSWRFEYPEQGIISNELYLPVDRQVELEMISNDVIHSFWVPEFRIKQDVLPGGEEMVRYLRLTPSRVGDYKVRCAEMCGVQHSVMESPVHVLEQSAFDNWIGQQGTAADSDDPAQRGAVLAQQFGCTACHSVDGAQGVGPTWRGVFGSEEPLADGTTVMVDDAYLHESIVDPGAKVVQGFQNIMPGNFDEQLTDEQIGDLIEFIKSLQ